ncbi:MAG TPA: 4a-hydroxytetrahydrobiopterin dehydratase [Candidatus Nanoarchaeia archaeon]|nr:4a-hydroxytetrahydrobiopterin dehydratase [Candidatus Nanoarchaeia archaeon]
MNNQKPGELDSWNIENEKLVKNFDFNNFKESLDFVNNIGELAEKQHHHPDIELGYGNVRISLFTHSENKLTEKDFELAKKIDNIEKSKEEEKSKKDNHKVRILKKEFITHDTLSFIIEKPENYEFIPGQATLVSLASDPENKRPFTFTSLNNDKILEFIIKIYPKHKGLTEKISKAEPGDELIIENPWGAIQYNGEGVFIAGGTGITPFISILRDLYKKGELKDNKLIFSNKEKKDIILEKELINMFSKKPENLILTLTRDTKDDKNNLYENRKINKEFLKEKISDFSQKFYVCGPEKFTKDIKNYLKELSANVQEIIIEE